MKLIIILITQLFIISQSFAADTLYEAYAKLMINDEHAGFIVTRYQFDLTKKQFISTYYLKTSSQMTDVSESLKAIADENLNPISYEYTSIAGKDTKTIDATFKGQDMTATIRNNGKVQKVNKKIEKGTFLSSFLIYLMLKSPQGLKSDAQYNYKAIAEEDADIYAGSAVVGKEELNKNIKAYKVKVEFKGQAFVSYVTNKGETISTQVQGQAVSSEIVNNPEDATGKFLKNKKTLELLFGKVPEGKVHPHLENSVATQSQNSVQLNSEVKNVGSEKIDSNIKETTVKGK